MQINTGLVVVPIERDGERVGDLKFRPTDGAFARRYMAMPVSYTHLSYIIDKESERQRDLQEVRDGLMMDWEYRVKWRGETEDEAKKILSEKKTNDEWMGFKGE